MKKRMILIAAICSLWMAVPVFAGIGVSIDGKAVNFTASGGEPVMDENGRTLVPLRAAMEAYGCTVSWDKVSRTASVFKDQTVVQVPVGQNKVTVNGTDVATDTQARIIEGWVYLPIRAVLEAFGASVGWDQASQTVTVRSAEGGEKHTGTPQKAALTAQEISEKCSPAVFFIKVYGFNGEMKGSGSGFFLSSDGLAVTNHHVIANSQYIEITTVDGYTTHDVKVIDYDKENDLALLKVAGEDFPYLETGDSAALKQGQQVYAIGSPLGLDNTMSQGIISNAKRAVSGTEYIQISVPIAMGSSGGALLDEQGRVIGVTTAGFMNSPGDLNLAIPIHCVNGLDRRATAEKVSYMDSYYSGYTQVLDFGAFSGAELVGSEKRGLGYILQYDAMDFHDVFETEAASCFANTLYYYRMALEEQGLKQQGAADITGVFASDTERVEVIADLEDTMSVFVIIQKEPQMYEKSPNLIDLGWYMGLETENPAEKIGDSWCYLYKWSEHYTYEAFTAKLYEYIELHLQSGYQNAQVKGNAILLEGYDVSAVFLVEKNKVFVDVVTTR